METARAYIDNGKSFFEPATLKGEPMHRHPRILIIEDMPEIADSLQKFIHRMLPSAYVFIADKLGFGLSCIEREQFVTILMDAGLVMSPETRSKNFTPDSLLDYIKRKQINAKIILMSGHSEEEVRSRIACSKRMPFLQKPFHLNELASLIEIAVSESWSRTAEVMSS
jgi:DNA-binding NtrC family response regulator